MCQIEATLCILSLTRARVRKKGPHFGLVLSGKVFNQQGLAMICPISQGTAAGARTYGTVVTLMGSGTETQGAVHCHQLKFLDWRTRKVSFKEKVAGAIIDEVSARVEAILFG
jgi:mRNA interferase ChpB